MDLLSHVTLLQHVQLYQAPASQPTPHSIEPGTELVEILTAGKVDFWVGDHKMTFGQGAMFWHRGGDQTIHLNHEDEPYQCLVLVFSVDRAPAWEPPRVSRWKDVDGALAFARLMLDITPDRQFGRDFHGLQAYAHLLTEARRAAANDLLTEPWPASLVLAIEFIESHFAEPIGLEEVASWAGVSLPWLHSLFANHLHRSPHRMILDRRLRRARQLLLETDQPLKRIASLAGFGTPQYLCRVFGREGGLSPQAFREAYRRH
jgi:AraC-like DNA-binding protein